MKKHVGIIMLRLLLWSLKNKYSKNQVISYSVTQLGDEVLLSMAFVDSEGEWRISLTSPSVKDLGATILEIEPFMAERIEKINQAV